MNILFELSTGDYIQIGGLIVALLIGFWNMRHNLIASVPTNMVGLNTAIKLANDRAFEAEKRLDEAGRKIQTLEDRLDAYESNLSYHITFDVTLGTNPIIEKVGIIHVPTLVTLSTK